MPVRQSTSTSAIGAEDGFELCLPVDLAQQVLQIAGNEINDLELRRLLRRQAHRLAHRALAPVGVAAAQLRQAADVGGGVVGDLPHHGVGPARFLLLVVLFRSRRHDRHRRSRAEIGAGRHGGEVARVEDEGAGARGACAARGHVRRDRDRRSEDVLDDVAHRAVETAGRVHAQHHELRLVACRPIDRAVDEIGARRADRAFERHDENLARRGERRRDDQAQDKRQPPEHPTAI